MPIPIRRLIADLRAAGYQQVKGGKGSHRKFEHPDRLDLRITISGQDGDDAKPYQIKQVRAAIEEVQE